MKNSLPAGASFECSAPVLCGFALASCKRARLPALPCGYFLNRQVVAVSQTQEIALLRAQTP